MLKGKQVGTEKKQSFTEKSAGGQLLKKMIQEGTVGPHSSPTAVYASNTLFKAYALNRFIAHYPAYIKKYYIGEDLGVDLSNDALGGGRPNEEGVPTGFHMMQHSGPHVDELAAHMHNVSIGDEGDQVHNPFALLLPYFLSQILINAACDVRHILAQIWLPGGATKDNISIVVEAGGRALLVRYKWAQSFLANPLALLREFFEDGSIDESHTLMHKYNQAIAVLRQSFGNTGNGTTTNSQELYSEMRINLPHLVSEQPLFMSLGKPEDPQRIAMVRLLQISGVTTGRIRQHRIPTSSSPNRRRSREAEVPTPNQRRPDPPQTPQFVTSPAPYAQNRMNDEVFPLPGQMYTTLQTQGFQGQNQNTNIFRPVPLQPFQEPAQQLLHQHHNVNPFSSLPTNYIQRSSQQVFPQQHLPSTIPAEYFQQQQQFVPPSSPVLQSRAIELPNYNDQYDDSDDHGSFQSCSDL